MDTGQEGDFYVAEENVAAVSRYLALPEVQRVLPRNMVLRWANESEGVGARLYRRLYEKQRMIAEDAYVNPGEDFLPVPESLKAAIPSSGSREL